MERLNQFLSQSTYFIHQVKEWAEIIADFETANKYKIENAQGEEIGGIFEQGRGFIKMLTRQILRSKRPMVINVIDKEGTLILQLNRPFHFFWSSLNITTAEGQLLGSAKRRFGFFVIKKYDLIDQSGGTFAIISSPMWRLWTFKTICPKTEKTLATISKKWGGLLKEAFSDADRFGVNYDSSNLTIDQKAIIFSTAITIDFDFFEDNNRN